MILMIDNYDSFTYNLVQMIGQLGPPVLVRRNDELSIEEISTFPLKAIFLSPGPCSPKEAGITVEVIRKWHQHLPILGVCLGHQAIAYAFGTSIIRAERIMHGKTSLVFHDEQSLYQGLPNPFQAIRYHSLIVDRQTLPDCLEVSAWTDQGEIMGLRHREYALEGVQFHPESIFTDYGSRLIENFLSKL